MYRPVQVLARGLLGLPFIVLGWDAAREPGGRIDRVAALGVPQPELAVRVNGYAMATAGTALALGVAPRLAAAVLVATLVPTTWAGHRFWEHSEPQQRTGQRIHFLKNLAMIGGLLLVAVRSGDETRRGRASLGRAR